MERTRSVPFSWGTNGNGLYATTGVTLTGTAMRALSPSQLLAYYNAGAAAASLAVTFAPTVGVERIVEWRDAYRNSYYNHKDYNKVWHSKTQGFNHPYLIGMASKLGDHRNGFMRRFDRANSAYAPETVHESVMATISTDQFSSRAWASMQPRFQGDVDLLVTLFELKDFRDIARYALRNTHYFDALRRFRRQFLKRRNSTPWFDPTVPASKAILTWNLAIAPTISAVQDIMNQMSSIVKEQQEKFHAKGLEESSTHYSEHYIHNDDRVSSSTYWWKQSGKVYKTVLTATLKYKYEYVMRGTINAFRTYWGLVGSVEDVWNMVPLSFLLDYFVKVGQAMRFAERDSHVTLAPLQYGESYKITHAHGDWFTDDSKICCVVVNGVVIPASEYIRTQMNGTITSVYYRRAKTPFKGLIVPRLNFPTERQIFNVASLARLLFT